MKHSSSTKQLEQNILKTFIGTSGLLAFLGCILRFVCSENDPGTYIGNYLMMVGIGLFILSLILYKFISRNRLKEEST